MKQLMVFLMAICVIQLNGCKQDSTQEKTTEWYKAHAKERSEKLAKCDANPVQLQNSTDCINARAAQATSPWEAKGMIKAPAPLTAKDMQDNKR